MNDLSSHKHLRILKLRGNKITQMEGISKNLELEVLELSENNIEEIGGLDGLNIK
jgi:Leucine-rich repeat (LRR) protein